MYQRVVMATRAVAVASLTTTPVLMEKSSWPDLAASKEAAVRRNADGSIAAVKTAMNYLGSGVDKVWTMRDEQGTDTAVHGAVWAPVDVEIQNGRGQATLSQNGFELTRSPAPKVDYYEKDEVVSKYYKDCEELVKGATGATKVRAFDHNIRSAPAAGTSTKGTTVQGPATMVHADYTATSAPRRVQLLGEKQRINDVTSQVLTEDEALLATADGHRFQIINVWRPLKMVEERPLAFCDASTVHPDDCVTFEIRYAVRIGENWFAKHRSSHDWYYFPGMDPSEAVLLKTWDSAVTFDAQQRKHGVQFVLHSAFLDPSSPPNATPRESIEVRTVAIFD